MPGSTVLACLPLPSASADPAGSFSRILSNLLTLNREGKAHCWMPKTGAKALKQSAPLSILLDLLAQLCERPNTCGAGKSPPGIRTVTQGISTKNRPQGGRLEICPRTAYSTHKLRKAVHSLILMLQLCRWRPALYTCVNGYHMPSKGRPCA